ncbi:MAG: glycosyltransferase family 39 protein, partial [Patescibacteria group bacterium]|nr:glycosyltransferase family 39 protein [Patescibacteria group bacterium]
VIRPIPIGWDDMGHYMNISNQIGITGELVAGNNMQAWSYMMSHGFTLLNSNTLAMFFSFLGGIFAIVALTSLINNWNTESQGKYGIVWTAIMYSLPMTIFQSTMDMKIDIALFAIATMAVYHFIHYIQNNNTKELYWSYFLIGLAFTLKPTIFMLLLVLTILLAYKFWNIIGIKSGALLAIGILVSTGLLGMLPNMKQMLPILGPYAWIFILLGLAGLGYTIYKDKAHFIEHFKKFATALLIFFIPLSIWFAKGAVEIEREDADIGFNQIVFGVSHSDAPRLEALSKTDDQAAELISTITKPESGNTSKEEELDRYLGYDSGAYKLVSQAWAQTMNSNQKGRYVEISYIMLLLIPLLALAIRFRNSWKSYFWIGFIPVYIYGYYRIFILQNPNIEFLANAGYGTTVMLSAIVFAIPGYLAYALHLRPKEHFLDGVVDGQVHLDKKYQILGLFTLLYWLLWLWIANGIIWYGIAGFIGLFLIIDTLYNLASKENPWLKWIANIAIIMWLTQSVAVNHSMANNQIFTAYAAGKVDYDQAFNMILPIYPDIMEKLNEDPEQPIYRIGTFIKYFIENNYTRLIEDSGLDYFNYLSSDNDKQKWAQRVSTMEARYIVFDLNAATIDRTEERTLIKKYEKFLSFLSENPKVKLSQNEQGKWLTDSTCLAFAFATDQPEQEFVNIAGGNHDSRKMQYCQQKIQEYLIDRQTNHGGTLTPETAFLKDIIKQKEDGTASLNIKRGAIALIEIVE